MTGEPEILPPEPSGLVPLHEIARINREVEAAFDALPPVAPLPLLPSGRWWVFIPGAGEATTMVNDHQLYWPRGTWFAVEDKHFHAIMDTDYPMQWYDGYDLCEKVIGTRQAPTRSGTAYRVIEKRVIRQGIQPLDDPTYDGRRNMGQKRISGL